MPKQSSDHFGILYISEGSSVNYLFALEASADYEYRYHRQQNVYNTADENVSSRIVKAKDILQRLHGVPCGDEIIYISQLFNRCLEAVYCGKECRYHEHYKAYGS